MWGDRETKGGNGFTVLKVCAVPRTKKSTATMYLPSFYFDSHPLPVLLLLSASALSQLLYQSESCKLTASTLSSLPRPPFPSLSGVSAIIFVASISEYDQCLYEDCATNRTVSALLNYTYTRHHLSCPVLPASHLSH
jgi:hypothetical protein